MIGVRLDDPQDTFRARRLSPRKAKGAKGGVLERTPTSLLGDVGKGVMPPTR